MKTELLRILLFNKYKNIIITLLNMEFINDLLYNLFVNYLISKKMYKTLFLFCKES